MIDDLVGDGLVEAAAITEGPQVQLQGFQLDTQLIRHIFELERGEVRLAGLRTQAGELGDFHVNLVIPLRRRVFEGFQGFAGAGRARAHDGGLDLGGERL